MKKRIFTYLIIPVCLLLFSCSEDKAGFDPPKPPGEGIDKARVWVTSGAGNRLLSPGQDIAIFEGIETSFPAIDIDFANRMQEMDGFGAALTGSSAWLINRQMGAVQRSQLLTDLFHPENGIGISYLRLPMGASDFSLGNYTYNDLPAGNTDPNQLLFSIEPDRADIIPILKEILAISPDIKIMGSPWSAPAWMKSNSALGGGSLKPEWYGAYALYFVKFIRAYQNEGIRIDAITVQNEPLHTTSGYPSMRMEAAEQNVFVRDYLGPLFEAEGIDTKIIIYDHNWDQPGYPIQILNDSVTRNFVTGSAFHAYGGDVSAMSQVHAAHPDKGLYFTEISGGGWATNFSDNLNWKMSNIFIGTANNWSKNALLWNLALDSDGGPKNGGCQDCRGVVTILANGGVEKNVEYYALAHMSKFVKPGARRVKSTAFPSAERLESVAFLNADGSKVLVVLNSGHASTTFSVKFDGHRFDYALAERSVATIVW